MGDGTSNGAPRRERVALVHDFLLDLRGAERVFLAMCDIWPEADVFTAVYDEEGTEGRFAHRNVHSTFLQRLNPTASSFRALLPFYPAAIESLDLSGYDLIVSSSSAWAQGLIAPPGAVHVCYSHNPFRYAWNDRDRTLAERRDPVTRAVLRRLFHRWRQWDWIAAQRVDGYVANSRVTQARVRAYFGRESSIVHPPVETARFTPGSHDGYYLVLSELMPHKRIDLAVHAFNRLRLPLVIAGDGPDLRRLRRMAGPTITFAGRVSDEHVARLLEGCRALVVTAVEEFGIAAVEAQAAGRPVISVAAGGALETVIDGVTGTFWNGGADQLAQTVRTFDTDAVDPQKCVESARRFDVSVFKRSLPREVEKTVTQARDERMAAGGRGEPPAADRVTARLTRGGLARIPREELSESSGSRAPAA
jgi:glycosyltransferase involved in cell wall biosynthesis